MKTRSLVAFKESLLNNDRAFDWYRYQTSKRQPLPCSLLQAIGQIPMAVR